jgi:hypothetical protein
MCNHSQVSQLRKPFMQKWVSMLSLAVVVGLLAARGGNLVNAAPNAHTTKVATKAK